MRNMIKIAAAARLVGREASTLRRWDQAGIYASRRATNGYRVYSRSDIEELRALSSTIKTGRPRKTPG